MKGGHEVKRICFGTVFTILYQARVSGQNPKVTNDSLCGALFSVFGDDFLLCGSTSGHLKSGHDNVPFSLRSAAGGMSFEEADANFQKYISPMIKDEMKEAVVRAIKDVLAEDPISDNTIIGYIDGYQKEKIIQKSTFSFSAIVVSVLYYSITKVDNRSCQSEIKSLDKDYVKSRINDNRSIYFEDSNAAAFLPIDSTLCDPTFNRIFEKIYNSIFPNTTSPALIAIYSADIKNRKINFRNAKQFVVDNLTSYVMSRERINKMDKVGRLSTAGIQSLQKFIGASWRSKETLLGETLLYVFMEQALGAYKILSKIEIDDIANKSKSDGVYFFRVERRGIPYNMLLFGASNIYGNFQVAVDSVFEKVQKIEQNYDDEFLIVDNTLNQNIFPIEMANYMKDILMPKKNSTNSNSPDMAFGCFLGYTVNVVSSASDNVQYEVDLKNQMKADIDAVIPYIKSTINKLGLNNYEFYFYVVPFNDATNERITLIDEMIGGI